MQKDMHYYGTYALARAAGIKWEQAQIIASASQFVDDNAIKRRIDFTDNGSLYSRPTAHHCLNIKNVEPDDQRVVWIPFHFLPGGEGDTFEERIMCRKDSNIARQMVKNHLSKTEKTFYPELIGVTAHVYADTFAHFGFSGLSSDKNDVDTLSITISEETGEDVFDSLLNRGKRFLEKIQTGAAEFGSAKLGHGGVYTYPDQPYLKWQYEYEDGRSVKRNNLEDFIEGCEALFNMFREVCKKQPAYYEGNHREFHEIKASLHDILAYNHDDEDDRIDNWIKKFEDETSNFTTTKETIPEYLGDKWNDQRKVLDENAHSSLILNSPIYGFYKAASYHRHFVLRDLLPSHGIVAS